MQANTEELNDNPYLEGMSKEEAFHTAQDELKKNSQPQQERPDWAAFILLDGIN